MRRQLNFIFHPRGVALRGDSEDDNNNGTAMSSMLIISQKEFFSCCWECHAIIIHAQQLNAQKLIKRLFGISGIN